MMKFAKEFFKTILYVIVIFFAVRFFIIQPFIVKGNSMEPSFHNNDYLFVNELTYTIGSPKRGDVLVFRHPDNKCIEFMEGSNIISRTFFAGSSCTNYIKRVIGLPKETVIVKNGTVKIVNKENPTGLVLNEDYVNSIKLLGDQRVELGEEEYFVLGDNRLPNASSDSRDWGTLKEKYIIGKAWLRVIPFNDFGFMKRPAY